jgi:hypothetical protein
LNQILWAGGLIWSWLKLVVDGLIWNWLKLVVDAEWNSLV